MFDRKRKLTQIQVQTFATPKGPMSCLFGLASDGSVHEYRGDRWIELASIRQSGDPLPDPVAPASKIDVVPAVPSLHR